MPLSNRAPVNAAGQIMVTGTTPTPAWPVLGGMTYDPVTGELAVTSAVPNATDPWVGGLRFTNLGALYIVTTIPSPVFYVGGLPVSTLGQLFMSANPPVGSVGGWPIAGDGGVAGIGSGIGPVPIFWAPLLTTLVPVVAGNPTFTFTRATTAYVADQDGILRQAIANEARFHGARRVRNMLLANTTDLTSAAWTKDTCTVTFGASGPTGQADANTMTATGTPAQLYQNQSAAINGQLAVYSVWIRRRTGTGRVVFYTPNNLQTDITSLVDGTWKRFASPVVIGSNSYFIVRLETSGDAVDVAYAQAELVAGQSNQAPGEYVSVGVLAAPYHGNAVDGVKYFATTNGNSVAGNVVTEAQGTLIPTATLLGYVAENAATNLCKESQTFDVGGGAGWGPTNSTIAANDAAAPAPDGTVTADRFTDDATSGIHRIQGNVATVSGVYTHSIYLKAGTLTWMQLSYFDFTTTFWANFNIATGAIGFKQAGTTATITALPNGWYRCAITFTAASNGISLIYSLNADTNSAGPTYVGTGQTMYLWGAQVEAGSDPSSYVPTTTVAVVRNIDSLQYPMPTNLDGALATVYIEAYTISQPATTPILIFLSGSNKFALYYEPATRKLASEGGGGATLVTANTRASGTVNKQAAAWSAPTASLVLNGGAVVAGAFSAYATSGIVGVGIWSGGSTTLQGTLRNVKFYNVRIADADLVVMTQ